MNVYYSNSKFATISTVWAAFIAFTGVSPVITGASTDTIKLPGPPLLTLKASSQ